MRTIHASVRAALPLTRHWRCLHRSHHRPLITHRSLTVNAPTPAPQSTTAVTAERDDAIVDESPLTATASTAHLPPPSAVCSALANCVEEVKQRDNAHYLAILFAPPRTRSALFTLRALRLELLKIRTSVSDERIAAMKYAWWINSVRALFSITPEKAPAQPVLTMLAVLIAQYRHHHRSSSLLQRYLTRLIEAYSDTADESLSLADTVDELDALTEATESTLLYLAAQLTSMTSLQYDHAASHIGKTIGIVNMLSSVPHNARHQRVALPSSLVTSSKVDAQSVFRGEDSAELQTAVFELAAHGKAHLHHARQLQSQSQTQSRDVNGLFLPAVIADRWLDQLEEFNFNVFEMTASSAQQNWLEPIKLRYALWRHARMGTF